MALITFDERIHQYKADGKIVPSVTGIISKEMNLDFTWVHAWYMKFGTAIHKAIELYCLNILDIDDLDIRIKPYLDAFILWQKEMKFQIVANEKVIYDDDMRVAGTVDILGAYLNSPWVVDIKSGQPSSWHKIQTAGYAVLESGYHTRYSELPRRACLYLKDNGDYAFKEHRDPRDVEIFKAFAVTYHRRNEYV